MKSTNWKDIAELVGITAILLGLYFVYAEIRQNVVIARAELDSITNQNIIEQKRWLSDPEFSTIFLKGLNTPGELNEVERFRLNSFYESVLIMYGFEHLNYSHGIFGEYTLVPRLNSPAIFGAGYGRFWWNAHRDTANPDIAEVIDKTLSELNGANVVLDLDRQIQQQIESN